MDFQEKLFLATQAATKASLAVLLLVWVITLYLFQRAILAFIEKVQVFDPNSQFRYESLDFSFLGMSMTWPLVLGFLCLLFTRIHQRIADLLEQQLRGSTSALPPCLVKALPLWISSINQTQPTKSIRCIGLIPLLVVTIHVFSVSWSALEISKLSRSMIPSYLSVVYGDSEEQAKAMSIDSDTKTVDDLEHGPVSRRDVTPYHSRERYSVDYFHEISANDKLEFRGWVVAGRILFILSTLTFSIISIPSLFRFRNAFTEYVCSFPSIQGVSAIADGEQASSSNGGNTRV